MNYTTFRRLFEDSDHLLHTFTSIGYEIFVAYDWTAPAGSEWVTFSTAGNELDRHATQGAAIAYAANKILADCSAETGEPQEILQVGNLEPTPADTEGWNRLAAERGTSVAELVATLAEAQR